MHLCCLADLAADCPACRHPHPLMPRLLNYIVAIYLIVVGLLGLFPHLAG